MKIWPIFYVVALSLNAADGFYSLLPAKSEIRDVGWTEITITFVIMMFAPLLIVYLLNRRLKPQSFDLPSWNRPLYKPLQLVRFLFCLAFSAAFGAAFALPFTNQKGMMNFFQECALALAVFLGERIIYAIYQSKISPSQVKLTN